MSAASVGLLVVDTADLPKGLAAAVEHLEVTGFFPATSPGVNAADRDVPLV